VIDSVRPELITLLLVVLIFHNRRGWIFLDLGKYIIPFSDRATGRRYRDES